MSWSPDWCVGSGQPWGQTARCYWLESFVCVSGETSMFSVQRVGREARLTAAVVVTVINWVIEQMKTNSPVTQRKKPRWLQDLVQKDTLGLESRFQQT